MFCFDLSMKSAHLKNSRKFKTVVKGEEGAEYIYICRYGRKKKLYLDGEQKQIDQSGGACSKEGI